MVAEILVILIQSVFVPIITELVKTALKKLSSSKELKELKAGLDEIQSMVDLKTGSLPKDPKVVMESLRRLKGAAEATESILGDSRATGIVMGCSINYLSSKTQLLPQGSESILTSLRLIVQGMESDLQKANVEVKDPVRQTLRRVVQSAASPAEEHQKGAEEHRKECAVLRKVPREPAEEPQKGDAEEPEREKALRRTTEDRIHMHVEDHWKGYAVSREVRQGPRREKVLPRPAEELWKENIFHRTASESQEEKCLCMPAKESPQGKSLGEHALSKAAEQFDNGKSLRKHVLSKSEVGKSLRKLEEEPLEGKSVDERKSHHKAVLSKAAEQSDNDKSLRKHVLSKSEVGKSLRKPEEEPLEGKSVDGRKSHHKAVWSKPAEHSDNGKSLHLSKSEVGKSLRKPEEEPLEEKSVDERKSHRKAVLSNPAEQSDNGNSLRKHVLCKSEVGKSLRKPEEKPLEGKSVDERKSHHKAVLSNPAEQSDNGKSLRKHVLSKSEVGKSLRKPEEEPLEGKSVDERKSHQKDILSNPAEQSDNDKALHKHVLCKSEVGKSLRKSEEEPLEKKFVDERKSHRKAVLSKPATGPSLRRKPN